MWLPDVRKQEHAVVLRVWNEFFFFFMLRRWKEENKKEKKKRRNVFRLLNVGMKRLKSSV